MHPDKVFALPWAKLYPVYLKKVVAKGRSQDELDAVIHWLTGYTAADLRALEPGDVDLRAFFAQAPAFKPNAHLVTGTVCGVRVEDVADPLMRQVRQLDKLVDELAKGRALGKILRG